MQMILFIFMYVWSCRLSGSLSPLLCGFYFLVRSKWFLRAVFVISHQAHGASSKPVCELKCSSINFSTVYSPVKKMLRWSEMGGWMELGVVVGDCRSNKSKIPKYLKWNVGFQRVDWFTDFHKTRQPYGFTEAEGESWSNVDYHSIKSPVTEPIKLHSFCLLAHPDQLPYLHNHVEYEDPQKIKQGHGRKIKRLLSPLAAPISLSFSSNGCTSSLCSPVMHTDVIEFCSSSAFFQTRAWETTPLQTQLTAVIWTVAEHILQYH